MSSATQPTSTTTTLQFPTAPRRQHLENQLKSPPGTPATPPRVHSSASPTKPRRSQRIADIGIGRNPKPQLSPPAPAMTSDAPAHNTRSKSQVRTIMQEAVLACITTYSDMTNQHITARNASCRKFPRNMLNAVLDMTTGKLMEMRHFLVNPKYKELWGKSYTKELGRLAQGAPGVTGTDTIIFI